MLRLAAGAGFDVEVTDPNVFPLSLQGPQSERLLGRLIAEPLGDIRFFRFIETHIDGIALVLARTGWSGQGGFELYLSDSCEGERLWDLLVDAGDGLNLRSGCPNLIDRIETGLLSHGNDMTLNNNPIEAGLDRFFQMGKAADYLGRDALERIASAGPDRRMARLIVEGDAIANPRETYPLTVTDTHGSGCVTSITFSPRLGFNVGLGYVPADTTAPGTAINIDTPTGTVTGHVADNDWQTPD